MLNCASCGYESPEYSRFCRQCGAPLLSERELAESRTRNYGRQGAAVAAPSAPLPPSISDATAGETARYHHPFQAAPSYIPPERVSPAANTASLKPKRRYLKWAGFLLALLISGGIGAAINEESNSGRIYLPAEDRARLERLRAEDRSNQAMTRSVIEQQERVREEIERKLEAIERAREEAERAAERGDVIATGEEPLDLHGFEYQGASAGHYSRIPGKELLTQRTTDDFEKVVQSYQGTRFFGKPFAQVNERNQKQALFQSVGTPSTPSITVLVRESRERSRQTEIIILRSPFRFPTAQPNQERPDAEESQSPPAKSRPQVSR
jgi:hypothetical protein